MPRLRFAPSPTGDLHVGGLRTALYNVLFARKTGGKFILRIEDTDQERNVPEAAAQILHLLRRCGLEPDEGPTLGGPYSPYVQSERLKLYRQHAELLLSSGNAYPCFCSPEQLEGVRLEQHTPGQVWGYDRACRYLEAGEARRRMNSEPHVLRLKVPLEGEIRHHDLVWGEVVFPCADVDDQVLVKTDGFPTYHLANVVDDHLMEITHVIRGEEWLSSIPKHLLLYRYFGWEPPAFAHLPLILNEKRQKLSKREGTGSVLTWLEHGVLPEALINYVALLGWHSQDDRDYFTFNELVEAFSLERVGRAGAVFDVAKLEWLSGEYIKRLSVPEFTMRSKPYLSATEFALLPDETLSGLLQTVQQGIHHLGDLPEKLQAFSRQRQTLDAEATNWLKTEAAAKILPLIMKSWQEKAPADAEGMLNVVREVGKTTGLKGKDLWMPLRAALTGSVAGPELKVVVAYLGSKEVQARLTQTIHDLKYPIA